MSESDRINYRLKLDPVELERLCSLGRKDETTGRNLWDPLEIPKDHYFSSLNPYHYIYSQLDIDGETGDIRADLHGLYQRYPSTGLSSILIHTGMRFIYIFNLILTPLQ